MTILRDQRGALPRRILTVTVLLAAGFCFSVSRGVAQQSAEQQAASPARSSVTEKRDVFGKQQWTDTGIDLYPGDVVTFSATGKIERPGAPSCGPDGRLRNWHEYTTKLPINQAGAGSLIGKIDGGAAGQPFGVGARRQTKVQSPGRLYLGVNEASNESAAGGYHVTMDIVRAGPAPAIAAANSAGAVVEVPSSAFPTSGLALVPLRVTNKVGVPGDMVNFVLIGSEAAVDQTFKDAGWRRVFDTNKEHRRAAIGGVFSGFTHKPFVEMPMSQLYLFGRPQDVGYAQGTAVAALGTRHHLRLWKAPMQIEGQDVWVGAGTHDESFMHDPHHKGFSHYIDPNVDEERAYIQQTLAGTREATQWTMVQPAAPVQTAYTVSGQIYHSDGQMLVLWLHATNQSAPEISAQAGGGSDSGGASPNIAGADAFPKN